MGFEHGAAPSNTRESAHDVRGSSVGRTGSEAQEVQSCKSNPPLSAKERRVKKLEFV